jgi:hypothetical protein
MTTTIENSLTTLARLAATRRVRTTDLNGAVQDLCGRLASLQETGDRVTVDGISLRRVDVRSNVGLEEYWLFESSKDDDWCYLDGGVGLDGYLHGDFNVRVRGPSRAQLIKFATYAERFVAALIARQETENAACERAIEAVERATAQAV